LNKIEAVSKLVDIAIMEFNGDIPVEDKSHKYYQMVLSKQFDEVLSKYRKPRKEEAQNSASDNTLQAEICPECTGKVDAIKWHCPICEENYEYGHLGAEGKLSAVR
jgi:hypothetical protein